MKKISVLLAGMLLNSVSFALDKPAAFSLDKVVFQLSAKEWVSTQSALLKVNVNATLNNADVVKSRADIMENLNKIAKGDWHLTQFDRSQDSSGLEKLFVDAQVRVPQSELTNVYQYAKDISKTGVVYTISAIEFKPSVEEIQQLRTTLRQKLYQQVNVELNELNKTYPTQQYTINRLYLMDGDMTIPTAVYKSREVNNMVMAAVPPSASPLAVSNEMTMTALVEAASNRKVGSMARAVSNQ